MLGGGASRTPLASARLLASAGARLRARMPGALKRSLAYLTTPSMSSLPSWPLVSWPDGLRP
eukprot:6823133-Alexandrium_andersonii.AAC.1